MLIEHLLCAGSEILTEPGTYDIYMSGETDVREIIMETLKFTQGYICEGAWEVLVPFPFSYLVLKKVEEQDEKVWKACGPTHYPISSTDYTWTSGPKDGAGTQQQWW